MEENTKKLSYEELEQYAAQISQQNQQLYYKVQESNMINIFKRLDYLFKVIEFSNMFDSDFVNKSINEIVDIMTPPTEITEEAKEEEEKEVEK